MIGKPPYNRSARPIFWTWLGGIEYQVALDLMDRIRAQVSRKEIQGMLLFLEHPPTITIGRRAPFSDVRVGPDCLARKGVSVFRTDRGGKATYHGPGQLVGYVILDMREIGVGVKALVGGVEEVLMKALAKYGISTEIITEAPGVWVNGKKIAAIGMRIKDHITTHGFALNVNCDLSHFEFINPCGMIEVKVANLSDHVERVPSLAQAAEMIVRIFGDTFKLKMQPVKPEEIFAQKGEAA